MLASLARNRLSDGWMDEFECRMDVTDDGGARYTLKAYRGRIEKLCHSTSTASAHYGVTVVWRDMHAHEMWKTLRAPRDTRQMCRIQAYKH